ncbi:sulfatase-like hydrolase/transferase [Halorussus salilacus]|uniref:sulfatase n=1 Tax=Halorussus salilacus TaxID=2953750 RepID=UPI0020A0D9EB|nr:sulfatase [Halorussus salilacus]USZ68665.1 sulfatase-like hydrolase/transferase [Halorussus salilacus]
MHTILITVDALRADHLGQYGHERDTMPALDRLTADGTRFEAAFSNAPYTRISIPSFQTSQFLAYDELAELPTIASILGDSGVTTAAVGTQTGVGLVDADFRFDQNLDLGRDEYHEEANSDRALRDRIVHRVDRLASRVGPLLRRVEPVYEAVDDAYRRLVPTPDFQYLGYTSAEVVTDTAVSWLEDNRDEDFFLWIHYMEGHRPYGVHDEDPAYLDEPLDTDRIKRLMKTAGTAPEEISASERRLLEDLYDSDLRYCSRHLDRLFDAMADLGVWDDANVVFSSDHGEEFAEHGNYFHRNYPYDELIHVPLLVKREAGTANDSDAPDTVEQQRQLLDLAPTVCAFHGIDPEEFDFEGEPLFEGDDRRVVALGSGRPDDEQVVAGRWDGWKFIYDDESVQLYDLDASPDETDCVADDHPEVVSEFREAIPEYLFDREDERLRDPVDGVEKEQLEALGYLELKD